LDDIQHLTITLLKVAFASKNVVEVVRVQGLHVQVGDLVPVAIWLGGAILTKVVTVSLGLLQLLFGGLFLVYLHAILFQLEW